MNIEQKFINTTQTFPSDTNGTNRIFAVAAWENNGRTEAVWETEDNLGKIGKL